MSISREEMETTIVWDEKDKVARIWTASPVTQRKLDKLVEQFPDVYKRTGQTVDKDGTIRWYEVNQKYIRFAKPPSEARREAGRRNAERLRSLRESKEEC